VERSVPVCSRDQHRLQQGEGPDVRLVRVGDRYVPWHEAGGSAVAIGQHRAHVVRHGTDTSLTDSHVAGSHVRAGMQGGANGPMGSGGGPLG